MKLRLIQLHDGMEIVSLIDEASCPLPWPSLFITNELYKDNHATNTLEARAYELRFFLTWAECQKIPIEQRIASGQWLTDNELTRFADAAKLKAKHAFRSMKNVVPIGPVVSDKFISNAIFNTEVVKQRVDPATTNGRLTMAARYLRFLVAKMHQHNLDDKGEWRAERMAMLLNKTHLTISSKSRKGKRYDGFNSAIPDEYFNKLINIIQPDHDDNPFGENAAVRERNQLIIELGMALGIRRGAIAKLKINDIDFPSSRIKVTRTPVDPTDTRRNRPQQKTNEHTGYISPQLQEALRHYIDHTRAETTGAGGHRFLFVAHSNTQDTLGQPLSLSSVNRIFELLSHTIGFHVTSHALRHKWNELFTVKCHDKGIPFEKAEKIRKDAQGWSKNSDSPERYNQYQNMLAARAIHIEMQEEIFGRRYNNDVEF